MNLPEAYLADLPAAAEITPTLISEAWLALERNRERSLARMCTDAVIRVIEAASQRWLESESPFMQAALDLGPTTIGFPKATLENGLRDLFGSITAPNLEAWVEQDLGHPRRLDEFCSSAPERASRRRSKAVGPQTLAHITAGNLPASAVMSMTAGLLVRSAQFVKCATGTSLIPRLFAHSLREVDARVGACLELAEWPRTRVDLQTALLDGADCVTAMGTDEAVTAVCQQVPTIRRFVGYGHRLSFAFLSKESLTGSGAPKLAAAVTRDVCSWNQLGCLSPQVIYVEAGGAISAGAFAAELASSLGRFEEVNPRGSLPESEAATIRSRRSFYEIRAAHSQDTQLWQSAGSTAWTVIYESDPLFQTSCLNRFIYVKAVASLDEALHGADAVRRHVSTVAVAPSGGLDSGLIHRLAEWGVRRICPVGAMQQPPVLWRHDGRPALQELVHWTDLEE